MDAAQLVRPLEPRAADPASGRPGKRSAQAGGWKPIGPRLGNGEAWFTTAVLAEARSTLAP